MTTTCYLLTMSKSSFDNNALSTLLADATAASGGSGGDLSVTARTASKSQLPFVKFDDLESVSVQSTVATAVPGLVTTGGGWH